MQPFSFHTFIFPFIIKDSWTPGEDYWSHDWLSSNQADAICLHGNDLYEKKLNYATFQYFNRSARSALFDDSNIVDCYESKVVKANKSMYIIELTDSKISLNINRVRLKMYPEIKTGVLIFETEYQPDSSVSEDEKRKTVMLINEYGRRVFPEFLPYKNAEDFILCAESLTVTNCNFGDLTQDVTDHFRILSDPKSNDEFGFINNPGRDSEIIRKILFGMGGGIDIEPAIDDRMFVCCIVADEKWTNEFCGIVNEPVEENYEKAKELYAVINCDSSGGYCSCRNPQMLQECLDLQLYKRWTDYGTLHAITSHSMFCLTGNFKEIEIEVINPFLTMYIQMCVLTIVQRSALIRFDFEINKAIENRNLVNNLMKSFAKFQGQIMLPEVTSQIQGIEIYQKLTDALFIKKLEEDIDKQIHNLFEITENENAQKQQNVDKRFTIIGAAIGLLAVFSAFTDVSSVAETYKSWTGLFKSEVFVTTACLTVGLPVLVIAVYYLYELIKKKRVNTKNDKIER